MPIFIAFLLAFFTVQLAPFPAAAQAPRAQADSTYLLLVDAALQEKDPKSIDFQKIRFAYAQTSFYHPYGGEKLWADLDAAGKAAQADKEKIPAYLELLRQHFGHFRAHVHAAHMHQSGGADFAMLEPHKTRLFSLVDSILENGDGKTPDTAFQIIDIKEEYFLMRTVFKVKPGQKRLLQNNGHIYDVFDVTHMQTGEEGVIHFNVDRIFARDP